MIIPNIWENKKWQPNHQPVSSPPIQGFHGFKCLPRNCPMVFCSTENREGGKAPRSMSFLASTKGPIRPIWDPSGTPPGMVIICHPMWCNKLNVKVTQPETKRYQWWPKSAACWLGIIPEKQSHAASEAHPLLGSVKQYRWYSVISGYPHLFLGV